MSKTYTWFSMVGGRVWRLTLSKGMKHNLEKFINFCNEAGSDGGNAYVGGGNMFWPEIISSFLPTPVELIFVSNSCRIEVSSSVIVIPRLINFRFYKFIYY